MTTLTQLVKKCAQIALAEDAPIVLYAASSFCGRVVRAFANAGVKPVCICDGDENKHGKRYYGIDVISPDDALQRYPVAKIFITSYLHASSITGHLVNNLRVQPERIIDYEEVEWKKSCHFLEAEAYLMADDSRVDFCCSEFGKQTTPSVKIDSDYRESAARFTQYRDDLILEMQKGNSQSTCASCIMFREGYYFVNRRIRKIGHSNGGGCNFRCIYCYNSAKHPVDLGNPDLISFSNLVSAWKQKGVLSRDVKLIMGAGEFTIHPERSLLYELCNHAEYILTNGSIFDSDVSRILNCGNTALDISIDAGSRQTFNDVKGVDCFNNVLNNIERYLMNENATIHLKYIFLPGINDNVEDVEGFIRICTNNRIDFVIISYDFKLKLEEVSENTLRMMGLMIKKLDSNGILYADYSGLTKTNRYQELFKLS